MSDSSASTHFNADGSSDSLASTHFNADGSLEHQLASSKPSVSSSAGNDPSAIGDEGATAPAVNDQSASSTNSSPYDYATNNQGFGRDIARALFTQQDLLASQPAAQDPATTVDQPPTKARPIVIGLYGVPGSGKSFLIDQLRQRLDPTHFTFYEGLNILESLVEGGLAAFKTLEEEEKYVWREKAIEQIRNECRAGGKTAIVAGHYMFWPGDHQNGVVVWTQADEQIYTHMLYLNVPPDTIVKQRDADTQRNDRRSELVDHIAQWQAREQKALREACGSHGILYMQVSRPSSVMTSSLLKRFRSLGGVPSDRMPGGRRNTA